MLNTNFRRLILALIVPVTGLGILAAFNQVTTAQVPQDLDTTARQQVAKLSGLPLGSLTVLNSVKVDYSLQGKTVFEFKVSDKESGAVYGISLDSSGQSVNSAQLQANKQATDAAQNGKLAPGLAKKLADTSSEQPIKVILWLKEPAGAETQRPAPTPLGSESSASEAQVNAFFAQVDAQRSAAVKPIVDSVATKLKKLGSDVKTEKYSPVVYGTLTPSAIRQAAALPEVDQVYLDTINVPELEVARSTINANIVNNLGFTGTGIRVAQIEVGGRIATSNPYLSGTFQDTTSVCSSPSSHSTGVAGIIRSTHSMVRGIAPGVTLWAGGSCSGSSSELTNRSTAAADWGARALNLSWGSDTSLIPDANDRFYDDMVINRFRTVVKSAGNLASGCAGNGNVTSPGLGYNVITVGNFDDKNTIGWSGDTMNSCSSWRDPISTNGDREKPEVSAPGTNINSTTNTSPWIGGIGSGTSYAAPMVTGVAALLIQRNSSLAFWPEAIKAILMTTAVHNIEGSARLSEFDGAGGIVADRADDVARGVSGTWGAQSYSCSVATPLNVATMSLTGGVRTRATIVWDSNPAYASYASRPSADLDVQVINSGGTVVASSSSFDNTYELVDFTPSTTGSYSLRVNKYRCDYDPRWLGWAWRRGN